LVGPLLAATEPESKLQKLLRQLREGDWLQRQEACLELGELSPRMLRGLARKTVEAPQGVPRDYKLLLTLARQRIHLEEGEVSEQLWREFQSGEFFLQEYATSTLGLTRGDVVSSLIELWPELEGLPRAQAVSVFRERGLEALEALPLLVELASETEDVDLLWRSALALGRVAPADPRVIDLARARLQSENTSECAAWLWVLGRAGEAGVPGLIAAMKDARLREEASARLALLGAPAFEPVLQAAAEVRSAKTRAYLLRVLGVIDPAHPEVVTRVLEACNDSSAFLRDEAFRVLGRLEMEDEQRCAILKKGLQDGSKKVRDAVREVIGNLGPQVSCLALDLVRAWEHDMPTDVVETVLFSGALRLLESLSPEAASALFDLYLRAPAELDAKVEVTFQATAMEWAPLAAKVFQERYEALERPVDKARGLYFLAGRGERTLQELEALLATGDSSYDTAILRCLSNEDSWTQALRDFVVESWHDDRLCMDVCLALAGGGDSVADLRSRVLADFADCSLEVQLALLGVFAKVQPDAPDYLELLVTLAEQTDVPELRVGVVEGLASGRSSPETRVSTLIALLTPEDPLRDLPGGGAHLDEDIRAAMWILAREHAAAGGLISTIFEALRSFDTLSQKQFDEIVVWAGTTHLHTQVNALRTFEKHG
ncbi:MAG: HEAT repeat domain-containing protein, partial [Planctomycetota bacterium]